jgi:hypothetical protein
LHLKGLHFKKNGITITADLRTAVLEKSVTSKHVQREIEIDAEAELETGR